MRKIKPELCGSCGPLDEAINQHFEAIRRMTYREQMIYQFEARACIEKQFGIQIEEKWVN